MRAPSNRPGSQLAASNNFGKSTIIYALPLEPFLMTNQPFSDAEVLQFHRDSFIMVDNFLDKEEISLLQEVSQKDYVLMGNAHNVKDTSGRNSKLALWDHPGEDLYGMISRSHKIVDRVEQLLDAEVYHYHSTMMLKEPRVVTFPP